MRQISRGRTIVRISRKCSNYAEACCRSVWRCEFLGHDAHRNSNEIIASRLASDPAAGQSFPRSFACPSNCTLVYDRSRFTCSLTLAECFFRSTVFPHMRNALDFYHATLCVATLCVARSLIIVILSVRPSVCLSVRLSHSWTVSTWFDLPSRFLHRMVAPSF